MSLLVPSLVLTFVPHFFAHCVSSGFCIHVTGFFVFAVGAVVCDFETVAPTVAVLQKSGHMTAATRSKTMGGKMWNKGWDERRDK